MFNVGSGEFLVIFMIALIVLGPDKLPEAARKVGKVVGDLRKMSSGFQQEMRQAMDVEGLSDLKNTLTGASTPTLSPPDGAQPDTKLPAQGAPPSEIAATAPGADSAPATHIPPSSPDLKSVPSDTPRPPASGQQGAA